MGINSYEEMTSLQIDVMREIGSIGTGNAVTALSSLMNIPVAMGMPTITIEGFNEAVETVGNPEDVVAAVMVAMGGDMSGIIMLVLDKDFINEILSHTINQQIADYDELDEMDISVLTEVGNIVISSYVSAMSGLAGMSIELLVPAISVNMLGGIMSVPMAELGYETDKLMMIQGSMRIESKKFDNDILMFPHIKSLNTLLDKLVGDHV